MHALLAALMLAGTALAADPLTMSAITTVTHGKESPRVVFTLSVSGKVSARVTCEGRTWQVSRDVSPRSTVELPLDGISEGTHDCEGFVELIESNGSEGEMTFDLKVASLPIIALSSTLDDIDLVAGRAKIKASRDVQEVQVTVFGAKGVQLDQRMGKAMGSDLEVTWDSQGREVVKLLVLATDANGFMSELTLLPWFYEIPHEDVVFETGSDQVRDSEAGKLETAWTEVVRTIDLYGDVVEINLFVAGYTDTVGDKSSNYALSERRARSIASWFRKRGFPGPIAFQGFGESVQAVGTDDEVDEPRNRRAIYVLAAQTPPKSEALPRGNWKKL